MARAISKDMKKAHSETRQERKRKRNETVTDLPEEDPLIAPETDAPGKTRDAPIEAGEVQLKKRKRTEVDTEDSSKNSGTEKRKKKSKESNGGDERGDGSDDATVGNAAADNATNSSTQSKAKKKDLKKKAKKSAAKAANPTPERSSKDEKDVAASVRKPPRGRSKREETEKEKTNPSTEPDAKASTADIKTSTSDDKDLTKSSETKNFRFIVFIGNLPYTTTTTSLTTHFNSLLPFTTRHLTEKDNPKKSKGYAFLEFESYDRMSTCLEMFHHSMFDDGLSPARKINVELTAGGGGKKSVVRKDRLKVKNDRLNERRQRKVERDLEKKKTDGGGKEGENEEGGGEGEKERGIHPSRRGRVNV